MPAISILCTKKGPPSPVNILKIINVQVSAISVIILIVPFRLIREVSDGQMERWIRKTMMMTTNAFFSLLPIDYCYREMVRRAFASHRFTTRKCGSSSSSVRPWGLVLM